MGLLGIDVSTYQGLVDWAAVETSGHSAFAYVKATEGVSVVDSQFSRNWSVLPQRNIPYAAYHYFHFSDDPIQQAEFFLSNADPGSGNLLPMVDVETTDGIENLTQLVDMLSQFVVRVEQDLGKRMLIYTGYAFWNSYMGGSDAFSGHPLWIAEYNGDYEPALPNGWTTWALWQYDDSGSVTGVTGDVDLDRLNGVDLNIIRL